MNITTTATASPWTLPVDLLAVACDAETMTSGVEAPDGLPGPLGDLDRALDGALSQALRAERFRGKPGQTVTFATLGRVASKRVAVIGIGPRSGATTGSLRPFAGRASRLALSVSAESLAFAATAAPTAMSDRPAAAQALTEGAILGAYRFDKYLTEDRRTPITIKNLALAFPPVDATATPTATPADAAALDAALARGQATAAATTRARDLINEPAVVMTPRKMAEIAGAWAREAGLACEILGPVECRKQDMGLFLAVAQGSAEEPRFIHLAWTPPHSKRRVVLVGKGVTFDSGGHSLKTSDGMLDMKTDMSGAAAVLSAIVAVAAEKLPIEVHALAACTENMLSGTAYRLGDVFRSKGGKTVEINNTDAEGRLTLADAIAFGLALKPDQLFDFATLTGACMVGMGPHVAGVMTNDEDLRRAWLEAAKNAGEEMWPLPLPERLLEQLKSEIADMKNTGERYGGALTAGLFLKEFVGDTPWVHVDMAGPARADKEFGHVCKGGTGFAVATILSYLRSVAA